MKTSSLIAHLQKWASRQPDKTAIRFLVDDVSENATNQFNYKELWERVCLVSQHLELLCQPGERVLLLYPPGLEFACVFLAGLKAGVTLVPAFPPTP